MAGGVDTASTDGTYDISNLDRLGTSEVEQVQLVVDGVEKLIAMEKRMEAGKDIEDLMPSGLQRMRSDDWMLTCLALDTFYYELWLYLLMQMLG